MNRADLNKLSKAEFEAYYAEARRVEMELAAKQPRCKCGETPIWFGRRDLRGGGGIHSLTRCVKRTITESGVPCRCGKYVTRFPAPGKFLNTQPLPYFTNDFVHDAPACLDIEDWLYLAGPHDGVGTEPEE